MDAFGSFISMPVVRVDSGRSDDEQSKKEKQRQMERQLPRMRIADKNKSEKMLEDAMQAGTKAKIVQESSSLPKPATVKQKQVTDELHHRPVDRNEFGCHAIDKESIHDQRNAHDRQPLQALDDLIQRRENVPSLPEILSLLKQAEKDCKLNLDEEANARQSDFYQEDMLCSLDFMSGYVSAFAEMPDICAEIAGVIESLRQQVTIRIADAGANIAPQQESLVQLISESGTTCSVLKDSEGRQKLVIEVGEPAVQRVTSSSRRAEIKDETSRQSAQSADDTLPLIVQRSV